jgi:integrase
VYRAVQASGDTKTQKSRRVLLLPRLAVDALKDHREQQAADRLAAGELWQDNRLVFASSVGTPMDRHNVQREFRKITEAAGLGSAWVPREMRHTFVSLMSFSAPLEDIADLVGHKGTATTETVYRRGRINTLVWVSQRGPLSSATVRGLPTNAAADPHHGRGRSCASARGGPGDPADRDWRPSHHGQPRGWTTSG